jgi:hypothetical protein
MRCVREEIRNSIVIGYDSPRRKHHKNVLFSIHVVEYLNYQGASKKDILFMLAIRQAGTI